MNGRRLIPILCLLSTAAFAGLVEVGPWVVEFTTVDGQYSRAPGYPSKEACEAAIPRVLQEQNGYNGHCIKWKDDHFIGSWDPALAGK